MIFESNDIIPTDNYSDGNLCNINQDFFSYYKMGSWDGMLQNGLEAPLGVYSYIIEFKQLKNSSPEKIIGTVNLIR